MSAQLRLDGMAALFEPEPVKPLSFGAGRLLDVLMGYHERGGKAFPKQATLGDNLGWTRETVCRYMAELKSYGLRLVHRWAGNYSSLCENIAEIYQKIRRSQINVTPDEPPSLYESPVDSKTEDYSDRDTCRPRESELSTIAAERGVSIEFARDTLRKIRDRIGDGMKKVGNPVAYLMRCLKGELEMLEITGLSEDVPRNAVEIVDECMTLYGLAGRAVPERHRQRAVQMLLSDSSPNLERLPRYIRWAFSIGVWKDARHTKTFLNLLSDGDWDVDITLRQIQTPRTAETGHDIAAQRFLGKRGLRP